MRVVGFTEGVGDPIKKAEPASKSHDPHPALRATLPRREGKEYMNPSELTEDEFTRFRTLIYEVSGIRIAETKRLLVSNRVRRRLRGTGIETFSAYYDFLVSSAGSGEMQPFLDAISTNETYFFRDPKHYEWLGDEFIPEAVRQIATGRRPRSLRFWSAACSTGEEPYSIALKLAAARATAPPIWRPSVLGTDLSGSALAVAKTAVYNDRAVHLVGPEDRRRYFEVDDTPKGKTWTLIPEVRSLVSFNIHNLLKPLDDEPFDCVFLKNVLIYFDADSKQKAVSNVLAALAKGGMLVIGPTEGIHGMLGSLEKIHPWLYRNPG